ncbi:AI-2E family transporter [Wenxinia marina]|uniref:Wenxma_12, whole genome shotgun sequence n=1 Tax=Wenxinia marina DSM 24838 TaxID=1123501 RepID=A0A0D0PB74_9RHOB|nr:AI-2E family transporter [Wenxinia marina]KIQ68666.1 putative permease [Wenxinia marina DSM 24838]GGL67764.1 AI-2E family transporter [Wenxinia marina]
MTLTIQQQLKYWGIAAAIFVLLLWFLGNVILPFILGGAIAYLLDPLADRLERIGLSRGLSVAVITILSVMLFVLLVVAVIPTLVDQATRLVATAPEMASRLQTWLNQRFPEMMDEGSAIRRQLVTIGEAIQARGGELLQTVLASAASVVNVVFLVIIVPVVSVYLLLDWDRMVARIDDMLPREHAPTIRALAADIDETLASFIRGQGTVCLILGVFYAVALALVGLNFGLVIGAVAGFLTFIPYVGALVGGALAIGMALFQFWGEWWWILAVWAIFQGGQFVEGNILTPWLVGSSVGLHPVWLLFALAVFGALFGFVGLLVAVPVAAVIGVIARFLIDRYKDSALYRGPGEV